MTIEEAAKEFARFIIAETWEGLNVDGADIQEEAVRLGLCVSEPFDPELHGPGDGCVEPGDTWFVFSKELAKPASQALDTRGFVRALLNQYAAEFFTDVDGDTLDDLLVAHGLAEWRVITVEEEQEPWAIFSHAVADGTRWFCLTDEAKKLLD